MLPRVAAVILPTVLLNQFSLYDKQHPSTHIIICCFYTQIHIPMCLLSLEKKTKTIQLVAPLITKTAGWCLAPSYHFRRLDFYSTIWFGVVRCRNEYTMPVYLLTIDVIICSDILSNKTIVKLFDKLRSNKQGKQDSDEPCSNSNVFL